ncbi:hypothetical protein [uncultured Methylobacterium sp.]|jgi:hypothetical protein|uniref:hypothetical protein n=1 Tax=uncultured Methylobacterium sp. TaxID=157278 RepID=UPI002638D9DE|nr:hypothetical protein [uncultured Methylobacterium sp.]
MKKLFALGAAAVLAASLAACSSSPYVLSPPEQQNAKLSAYETADRIGADLVTVMNQDSDRDGYVTATFKGKQAPHVERDFLCPYKISGQCRPKSAK